MSENLIPEVTLDDLSVRYPGGVLALDHLNLHIGQGLFGLLGPNGAGKTTLMRTLATLQQPTSGKAMICGFDVTQRPGAVRQFLGYLPQDFETYPQLKVREVLDFYAILNQIADAKERQRRIDLLLDLVGLQSVRSRNAGQLSGGMLRRLGVAQALLNNPRLLILDEPTVGLDPAERINFRTFLAELSRDRVVILSTHIVSDIGSSCAQLAILNGGRLRFTGPPSEVINSAAGKVWRVRAGDRDYAELRQLYSITGMVDTGQGLELRLISDTRDQMDWEPVEPTLEDAYLRLLNGKPHLQTAGK